MSEQYLKVKDLTSYDYVKYINRIVVIPINKYVGVCYKDMVNEFKNDFTIVDLVSNYGDYYVSSVKNFDVSQSTSICIYFDKTKSDFKGVM